MTYEPDHQHQLGRGTPVPGASQGSRDCGPRTLQMGIDALTHGELVPAIREIREAMGEEGPQTTDVLDFARAVPRFRVVGRRPLGYRVIDTVAEARASVAAGRFTHLCIDYGTFDRLVASSGDPGFDGGHSVGVMGQRTEAREVWWRLFDPLDDQRRTGIPQGPRWVRRVALVNAMEAFAGAPGRAWAGRFTGGQKR